MDEKWSLQLILSIAQVSYKYQPSSDGKNCLIINLELWELQWPLCPVHSSMPWQFLYNHLIPCDHKCLLSRVSTLTSGVPIIFSANFRISLTALGALFLNPLQENKEHQTITNDSYTWPVNIHIQLELVFVKHYAPNCLTLTLFDSNTA